MRRNAAGLLAALSFFALAGCDEERTVLFPAAEAPAPASVADQPAPSQPARRKRRVGKKGAAAKQAESAAAGADSGRVLFDGAKPGEGDVSAPSVASGGEGAAGSDVELTGPARTLSLKIKEPPAPKGKALLAKTGAYGGADPKAGHEGHGSGSFSQASGAKSVAGAAAGKGGTCPAGMVKIDGAFCIDPYESALVETGGAAWSPYLVPDPKKSYAASAKPGQTPQGYISGDEAKKACVNAGKRLCGMTEWLKACKGPAGTTYPYGAAFEPGRCNEHDRDPTYTSTVLRVFPGFKFDDYKKMNDPRINQQPNGLLASGAKDKCVNGYGLFDMVGNLHEWIEDAAGTFKGGYYSDTYRNGAGCAYTTTAHDTSYHDYSTGFRCCADPK